LLIYSSQDLLKCIHHFASHFYAAEGVLLNKARDYREEKKTRKAKRDKETGDLFADHERGSEEDENAHGLGEEQQRRPYRTVPRASGHEEEEYVDEFGFVCGDKEEDEESDAESGEPPDMYKALNGRALMALGKVTDFFYLPPLPLISF
jgi:hypothetical protein